MAESDEKTTLQILTLTIQDCLGCKDVNVEFSEADSAHLLIFTLYEKSERDPDLPIVVTPVGNALKLMCTMEYPDAESLQRMPQLKIGKGCITLTFSLERQGGIDVSYDPDSDSDLDEQPSTSREAEKRRQRRLNRKCESRAQRIFLYKVNVLRRFDNVDRLDRIHFQLNAGMWREVGLREFHDIFFVQPPHRFEITGRNQQYANNWLKIIQANTKNYSLLCEEGNPFDTFAKLFERRDSEIGYNLERLTTQCLALNETARLTERRFLLNIFKEARTIFEYITVYEYTVWFFVPRLNCYTSLNRLTVEDFDLSNVRTCIKLTRDESDSFWQRADHNIMDILLVSLQMALAKAARQSMLFLGQLDKLSDFVCMQFATAYFMNSFYTDDNPNAPTNKWICRRYLHRIIEMAETLGFIVFIEYPSTLTLLPNNRRYIKCIQQKDQATGAITWNVSMEVTKSADGGIKRLRDAIDSD